MTHHSKILLWLSVAWLSITVSCASTDYARQVENLGKVGDGTKAYLVAKIDNRTGRAFLAGKLKVSLWVDRALTNADKGLEMVPKDNSVYATYEVKPGTYRIADFIADADSTTITYHLDPVLYTFFKVNPGEVVYLGDYVVVDDGWQATTSYDLSKVKDAMVAQYPQWEGFRWVDLNEDRPSF